MERKNLISKLLYLFLFLFFSVLSFAQPNNEKPIELISSDQIFGGSEYGSGVNLLVGNVVLRQEGYTLKCDSATLDRVTNISEAFGNAYLNVNDSIHLYGDKMIYRGNDRTADVIDNVKLKKDEVNLFTDKLFFDGKKDIAYYNTGGKITDTRNILTSKEAIYFTQKEEIEFKKKVVVKNKDVHIYSSNLLYETTTKISNFIEETHIYSTKDNNYIYTTNGKYDTKRDVGNLYENSVICTNDYQLTGQHLYYNRKKLFGRGIEEVEIIHETGDAILKGDYGEVYEAKDSAFVTRNSYGIRVFSDKTVPDSLFIHADTISVVSKLKDSLQNRIIRAHKKVRFFKNDIQGRGDSLVVKELENSMDMYYNPVVWSRDYQVSGDTLSVLSNKNNQLDSIKSYENAFILFPDEKNQFNQVKGKYLFGKFIDDTIRNIKVITNAESLYYAREERKESELKTAKGKLIGVNHITCATKFIKFVKGKIEYLTCNNNPDAQMYPIYLVPEELKKLNGYNNRFSERPTSPEDLFEIDSVSIEAIDEIEIEPNAEEEIKEPQETLNYDN